MRLHHLEATAFGPFADTVTIDFDELSDAGLFLLSGATGAGKTSVLDAVCFALYGDVPGDRNTAKRLRSDQAPPGVAPRVVLEATLAGRRFRITRSPSWERPKKRGSGTTTEQASVTLQERVDGDWRHLSSRLDETGHLVSHVVGMTVTQFTQVAMLPQGRFQAFLRARSEERHAVLQQLFRTGRFADVERWLRERRVRLRRASEAAHQGVADLVSRLSEAVGAPLPDAWDLHDLSLSADDGELLAWADELRAATDAEVTAAATDAGAAADAEAVLRDAVETARATHERVARHHEARAERAALLAVADEVDADRARLHAARRAAAVAPLVRLSQQARAQRDRLADQVAGLATGRHQLDRDDLAAAVDDAVEQAARIRALLPAAARLTAGTQEIARLETRLAQVRHETESATLRRSLARVEVRIATLEELADVSASVLVAHQAWNSARETALSLQEQLLTLREARLDSMAGEIACALAVGASCPVCGSADHPHKAAPVPGAPDAAAEKAALKDVDDAKATEHLRELEVRDLTAQRDRLAERAGDDTMAALRAERDRVEDELAELLARAGRQADEARAAAQAGLDPDALDELLATLASQSAETTARLDGLTAECLGLRSAVDDALRDSGHDDLGVLLDVHVARAEPGRQTLRALEALATAETSYAEARDALTTASLEAGFAAPAAAVEAALGEREVVALEDRVATHDQRLAAVDEVLGAPGADDLDQVPLPDLPPLVTAHADALARLAHTRGRHERALDRTTRLAGLRKELSGALERWAPVRADLDVTVRLAAFVEGKAPDNRLKMRLSAYVLAYRLGQVVAAANERLAGMSDQRYSLVHTGDRGAGETRGGLSLVVRDDWSGETRDPATLSGGETFVVSLALALGLADVITQEVGGAALDTLFVDEGFGSLDADTLDDVMDTLDSLRDGGRVVGVVSHVAELRDRIPTQLVVAKSRTGSTVSVRLP